MKSISNYILILISLITILTSDVIGSNLTFDLVNSDITILGENILDNLPASLSSIDINGDKISDIIFSTDSADINGKIDAGKIYVIYGKDYESGTIIDLSQETADIVINGVSDSDRLGYTVSSGDINGDGFGDSITIKIGTEEVYVIYGKDYESGTIIDLSQETADIVIKEENFGTSIDVGDINKDDKDDIIIEGNNKIYVIYGKDYESGKVIDLLEGTADITINGENIDDGFGKYITHGDWNNDKIDDIIVSAIYYDIIRVDDLSGLGKLYLDVGKVYIFYGEKNNKKKIIEANQANMVIIGPDTGDAIGSSIASNDINKDNSDDIIIGAEFADVYNPFRNINAGKTYIIYSNKNQEDNNHMIDLRNNKADITIYGTGDDHLGSVSSLDFNNDNIEDIVIGARSADPIPIDGEKRVNAGETYVIYGIANDNKEKEILTDSYADITFIGKNALDSSGGEIGKGDINGDKIEDIIIGANFADPNGKSYAGEIYVLFGSKDFSLPPGLEKQEELPPGLQQLPEQPEQKSNSFLASIFGFFLFIFKNS